MSTSNPPQLGSPAQSYLSDDAALRRAFDAEFDAAVADVRTKLGDATIAAPRVVELAFINAWQQRATLGTHEHFKKMLEDELHHGAARALSRRAAASRFSGSGAARDERSTTGTHGATGEIDRERSWAQIIRTIHGEGQTADAHATSAATARHDAAAHMKGVGGKRRWLAPVAFGLLAVAISVTGIMYVDRLGEDDAVLGAVAHPSTNPIQSSPGQLGATSLPDGSKMRMGPATKISLADGFPATLRALKVEGTAQFDVAAGQKLPFRVVIKRSHVIATGTSFAVSAFPDDSGALVQVREGSVLVKAGKQQQTVSANQTVMIEGGAIRAATPVETAEAFGWLDGRITVSHEQLRKAVAELSRWYNVDVKVPDLPLLDRDASFSVSLDSMREAIKAIEQSAHVTYETEGVSQVFRDAGAKK
jgi:ferric-dicitrate binding protein FerR (iron transport regulator)